MLQSSGGYPQRLLCAIIRVMISREAIKNRFLRYVSYDTMSDPSLAGVQRPTTDGQSVLQKELIREMDALGLKTYLGEEKVAMGTLEGNAPGIPVAFMAHVDTADDVPGNGVRPRVISSYDGSVITLENGVVIDPADEPDLLRYTGSEIITSDGTTLLGSDDKAGIAIIMTLLEHLHDHPEIPHPLIEVFFTPDEETGTGMDMFPYDRMVSKRCYTIDGSSEGEIEAECFNAASLHIIVEGDAVHPGSGRGRIHNAAVAASSLVASLPSSESPEATDGRFGYYGVESISGNMTRAEISLFLRDFDFAGLERRIGAVEAAARGVELLHSVRISISSCVQYRNMKEANDLHPEAMDAVRIAAERTGIAISEKSIRGGTDGARLAEKGIPCPNIFTGGHSLHSLSEWVAVLAMGSSADLLLAIVEEGVEG